MAIKRRTPTTPPDPEAIEAFGAAAEPPAQQPAVASTEPVQMVLPAEPEASAKVPRTLLIRYPDANLPVELAAVAALEDRSQHATALRALRRGLAILRAEARE